MPEVNSLCGRLRGSSSVGGPQQARAVVTDFDDQDYEAIGRAVVACARVEGMARPILAALMNLQEGTAQIAFSDRGHSWVFDALQNAMRLACCSRRHRPAGVGCRKHETRRRHRRWGT